MAVDQSECLNKVKLFLHLLQKDGISVSEAYLFGSVISATADSDSDIDVAVVSKDFQGVAYYDMQKISKWRRQVDLRLEIHPFSLSEVETDPPLFFTRIRRDGLKITE
jgi:hypothetical protein